MGSYLEQSEVEGIRTLDKQTQSSKPPEALLLVMAIRGTEVMGKASGQALAIQPRALCHIGQALLSGIASPVPRYRQCRSLCTASLLTRPFS